MRILVEPGPNDPQPSLSFEFNKGDDVQAALDAIRQVMRDSGFYSPEPPGGEQLRMKYSRPPRATFRPDDGAATDNAAASDGAAWITEEQVKALGRQVFDRKTKASGRLIHMCLTGLRFGTVEECLLCDKGAELLSEKENVRVVYEGHSVSEGEQAKLPDWYTSWYPSPSVQAESARIADMVQAGSGDPLQPPVATEPGLPSYGGDGESDHIHVFIGQPRLCGNCGKPEEQTAGHSGDPLDPLPEGVFNCEEYQGMAHEWQPDPRRGDERCARPGCSVRRTVLPNPGC